jgi:hypothetical protein
VSKTEFDNIQKEMVDIPTTNKLEAILTTTLPHAGAIISQYFPDATSKYSSDPKKFRWILPLFGNSEDGRTVLVNPFEVYNKLEKIRNKEKISFTCDISGKSDALLFGSLALGVGMHFASLEELHLREVERLFRMKLLKVCMATGTLSYGINMPCRTVVLTDEAFMSSIMFGQCVGRAGRRGFDAKGNVIILGIHRSKVLRLMSSGSPNLRGSMALNISFILRLLCFYHTTSKNTTDPDVMKAVEEDCLSVFHQPLSRHGKAENITNQQLHYLKFAIEFLRSQNYVLENGAPNMFSGICARLFYLEPYNFLFATFLREGLVHNLLKTGESLENRTKLLTLMARLFEHRPPMEPERKLPSVEALDPKLLKSYHRFEATVVKCYSKYLNIFAQTNLSSLQDCFLPVSNHKLEWLSPDITDYVNEHIPITLFLNQERFKYYSTSSFCAIAGYTDNHQSSSDLYNVKHTILIDPSIVPSARDFLSDKDCFLLDWAETTEAGYVADVAKFPNENTATRTVDDFSKRIRVILGTATLMDVGQNDFISTLKSLKRDLNIKGYHEYRKAKELADRLGYTIQPWEDFVTKTSTLLQQRKGQNFKLENALASKLANLEPEDFEESRVTALFRKLQQIPKDLENPVIFVPDKEHRMKFLGWLGRPHDDEKIEKVKQHAEKITLPMVWNDTMLRVGSWDSYFEDFGKASMMQVWKIWRMTLKDVEKYPILKENTFYGLELIEPNRTELDRPYLDVMRAIDTLSHSPKVENRSKIKDFLTKLSELADWLRNFHQKQAPSQPTKQEVEAVVLTSENNNNQ